MNKLIVPITLMCMFVCTLAFSQDHDEYLNQSKTTNKTFEELSAIGEAYFAEKDNLKGIGYKPFKRWQYWSRRNLDKNGRIITEADAYQKFLKFKKQDDINKSVTGTYTPMGPTSAVNTSTWSSALGRLTYIDVHDTDANHILVGAPGGGAWKTLDYGTTWTPLFDEQAVIGILSVNINHANANDYLIGTSGGGIYRSTDQGATWAATTGPTNDHFIDIKRHPVTSTIVFATGKFFGETWRSTDSGANWAVVDTQPAQAYDLEFKPGDPTTIYVSGNGSIKKSTDTGVTWTALASGGTWSTSATNTLMLAVSPAAANDLFVLEEANGGFQGIYKSTNSGSTYAALMTWDGTNNIMGYDQAVQDGQAPRDMDIAVSPTNTNIIHVAGTEGWKSVNGGTSFTKSGSWNHGDPEPFIHADVDQLVYHGNRFFAATDGGIFVSDDDATTWTDKTPGLNIRQFYRIGASQTDADRVAGGSQDNGAGVRVGGTWNDWLGADGMETLIDWSNANIVYGNTQNGTLYKSLDGGVTNSFVGSPGSGVWVTPTEQDPTDANTIYHGKDELYKSTDGAATWNTISAIGGGLIYEVKIAPSDNQTIYIALGHDIHKTTNGGTTWTNITPGIAFGNATYIAVHPTTPNRVSLTLSGATEKIIESTDGGTTWVNISSNLPGIGSQCVMYENDTQDGMYVGMNPGLYFKDNTTAGMWSLVNGAMPNVSVTEVEARNGVLYIGTYGRGLWKVSLSEGMVAPDNCASPMAAIPDGDAVTGVASTINLTPMGTITDVNIDLKVLHAYVGDIKATITHLGTTVVLMDQPGVPASTYGCSQDNIDCTFDDQSTNGTVEAACPSADPTYMGDYNPEEVLSIFNGMEGSGDWILTVYDIASVISGTLDNWCINVTVENPCNDTDLAIPDGDPTGASSTITLASAGTISDVNINVDILQNYVGDMKATLSHGATAVVLFDRPGYTGTGFGCSDNNVLCTFDDQSTNGTVEGVCAGTDPAYSGDYNPEEVLSAFNGQEASGVWTLTIIDYETPDPPTLQNWCLDITTGAGEDPCPPNYAGINKLTGPMTADKTYTTPGDLESEQAISGASTVTYSALGYIELLGGFSTDATSTFTANNTGCPE